MNCLVHNWFVRLQYLSTFDRDERGTGWQTVARRNLTSPFGPDYVPALPAEVVELVDALASGASGRKLVGVRVPPSALTNE